MEPGAKRAIVIRIDTNQKYGIMNAWVGPTIEAGSGFLGSMFNYATQKKQLERQNIANKEMAQYQYDLQTQAWNRANEYNTPENQMARLEAAGVNPNLAYGKGAGMNTAASQLPKYQAPKLNYQVNPQIEGADIIGKYQDVLIRQAQIDLLNKDKEFKDEQIEASQWARNLRVDKYFGFGKGAPSPYGDRGHYQFSHGGKLAWERQFWPEQLELLKSQRNIRSQESAAYQWKAQQMEALAKFYQKRNNWYTANQISNIANQAIRTVGGTLVGSKFTKIQKGSNKLKTPRVPTNIYGKPLGKTPHYSL